MTTIGAHKILIACAILFTLGPIIWGVTHGARGESIGFVVAAGAAAVAVGLAAYLRSFLTRHKDAE
jgi:hypothetical protein